MFELVHAIGSSIYFVFFLLFLWASAIPRTGSGARYWAWAILCALLARLFLLALNPLDNVWLSLAVYYTFNILEKPFLLMGGCAFFNVRPNLKRIWGASFAAIFLGLIVFAMEANPWLARPVLALFNAGALLFLARVMLTHRKEVSHTCGAIVSDLFVVHWLAVFPIMYYYPGWKDLGFVVGTALALGLYLALLVSLLNDIRHRLVESEAKALDMAYQDPLTGLRNKRYMSHIFEHAVELANRPHQRMALFYIDLDNFKPINDSGGHRVGDEVLKTVALRIKGSVRSTDICVRAGGDEFIVIATQLEHDHGVSEIAQKLLESIEEGVVVDGGTYYVGASIGIALYPAHETDIVKLVEQADAAMYQVKQGGKSGYSIYGV